MANKEGLYERAVQAVLDLLSEKSVWNLKDLVLKASERSGWKYLGGIEMAVKSLVVAGRCEKSGKWVSRVDRTPEGGTSDLTAVVEDLRRRLASAEEKAARAEEKAALAEGELKKAADQPKTTTLELRVTDQSGKTKSIKGVFHGQFKKLFQLANARMNLFLYGPTGCGKTHVCSQLAETLGLRFAFISCSAGMSEGQLLGRLLPVGKGGQFEYVPSEFVTCYEEGGVFLLDELDAADPNVLLIVNAALANGHLALPNRPAKPTAKRHKDFVCVAAANTVGIGADRLYSGRNKLDAATLDRFQIGKVYLDYDPAVEEQLCPDAELRDRLQQYRKAVKAHGLERAVSTRFLRDAYLMKSQAGWTEVEIDAALFQGWREDEVTKVKSYRS